MSARLGKFFREGDRVIDTNHPSWGEGVVVRVAVSGVMNGLKDHVHFVQWPNGRRRDYPQVWQTLTLVPRGESNTARS